MDDIHLISSPPPSAPPAILKPNCSPLASSTTNNRQRTDSASVIQQSDVSSSRPALLAHDALGPLLFEVCSLSRFHYFVIWTAIESSKTNLIVINLLSQGKHKQKRVNERTLRAFLFLISTLFGFFSVYARVERMAMTTTKKKTCYTLCLIYDYTHSRNIMHPGTEDKEKRRGGIRSRYTTTYYYFFLSSLSLMCSSKHKSILCIGDVCIIAISRLQLITSLVLLTAPERQHVSSLLFLLSFSDETLNYFWSPTCMGFELWAWMT